MSRNPVAIVIPCHRVIASGGKLGGFGNRLDLKWYLLSLETDDGLIPEYPKG
jgi:methylated-DNA-[protein]-cysteine S-methyltransferase